MWQFSCEWRSTTKPFTPSGCKSQSLIIYGYWFWKLQFMLSCLSSTVSVPHFCMSPSFSLLTIFMFNLISFSISVSLCSECCPIDFPRVQKTQLQILLTFVLCLNSYYFIIMCIIIYCVYVCTWCMYMICMYVVFMYVVCLYVVCEYEVCIHVVCVYVVSMWYLYMWCVNECNLCI